MGRKNRRDSGAGGDPEIIYDDGPGIDPLIVLIDYVLFSQRIVKIIF